MTNLIPPDAKKGVRREYWIRVLSVWALLLSASFVIFTVALLPTYVLFSTQFNALLLEEATKENGNTEVYKEALGVITDANITAAQLDSVREVVLPSTLLREVERAREGRVTLTSYSYTREKDEVKHIVIRGTAVDRTSLAAFAEALKTSPFFSEANVPVSSLIKDQNLPFDITVTVTPKNAR